MILELGAGHRFDVTHRALVSGLVSLKAEAPPGPDGTSDVVRRAVEELVAEGADAITFVPPEGPDAPDVVGRELRAVRVLTGLPLGVRTSEVATLRPALASGAVFAEDPSGFADVDYLRVCASSGASVMATHIGGGTPSAEPVQEMATRVRSQLRRCAEQARSVGIPARRILLSDGLDRGRSVPESLELLRTVAALAGLGFVAALSSAEEGLEAALPGHAGAAETSGALDAVHAVGIIGGCRMLQVNDVGGARRTADVVAELLSHRVGEPPHRSAGAGTAA